MMTITRRGASILALVGGESSIDRVQAVWCRQPVSYGVNRVLLVYPERVIWKQLTGHGRGLVIDKVTGTWDLSMIQ
ncbi:MAG: hypothetical protein WBI44_11055 [Syntrophaceticus sp.]